MQENSLFSLRTLLLSSIALLAGISPATRAQTPDQFQHWRLPASPPHPADNQPNAERVELGKMLFFDRRVSGNGSLSCASCHLAELAWSDGKAVPTGASGKPMARNSQSLVNVGYNPGPVMWAGQKKNLEDQVSGPANNPDIMGTDVPAFSKWLSATPAYKTRFDQAYPGEEINLATISKALANFERTLIQRDSVFDHWLDGKPMSAQQLRGLHIFTSPEKGNCAVCHTAPAFSDNGFHNIGLASNDVGRHKIKPLPALMGAFKTPQLRDIERKAPYMHDGSLKTLMEVVEHYNKGGVKPGVGSVSALIKPLNLTQEEKQDLVAFLQALSGPVPKVSAPALP